MKALALTAYPRTLVRRVGTKKLRAAGRIPAVIYGAQTKAINLEFNTREFTDLIGHSVSETLLLDLSISGETSKRLALLQEVQHHPLSGKVLHVDLHQVQPDETVTVTLPVETKGEPVGVKSGGGILQHTLLKIKVRALPRDLPEAIIIDVSHLEAGKAIHIGEVVLPAGVELLGKKEAVVVKVAEPKKEVEAAPVEGSAPAAGAVEMIKEKKDKDGDAKAPAAAAGKADEKKPAEKKK
jgi:large subunit ribosomal protein L25